MYKIVLKNVSNTHEYEELIKVFLRSDQYEISQTGSGDFIFRNEGDKNLIKKDIYLALKQLTGLRPPWGIVTGIRPVKMTGEIFEKTGDRVTTINRLEDYYCISNEKANLAMTMYEHQIKTIGKAKDDAVCIYIGIPFCPTRCLYCSFASNQVEDSEIERYIIALHKEIDFVDSLLKEKEMKTEAIYIGGGTPTSLSSDQMEELLEHINKAFRTDTMKEFTVEAGRPDTITKAKLRVMKKQKVDRISINPQTMNDKTLQLIGRNHTSKDIRNAFHMTREIGIKTVNADIIAGLPGETIENFNYTLEEVEALKPENITVHSLAVKRASRLVGIDSDFHYKQGKITSEMLCNARAFLAEKEYIPYYLYRQKHMSGAQENTGYCKAGTENIYNIRIMDEHETIIALGAGGISKRYYPDELKLKRVPNVTNYEIYIERLDEMIQRKRDNI